MIWVENPKDATGIRVEIVPADFDGRGFCLRCGGAIQFDFKCSRCHVDYFPAIQRRNREQKKKSKEGKT